MRKILLYIATSIDGYIAKPNGDVDWLFHDDNYGYTEFSKTVDTTIMGYKTYSQVLTFGEFPYKNTTNYVLTRNPERQGEHVKFISNNISDWAKSLKQMEGESIWLIGGSDIVEVFLNYNLIDEIILSVHPIVLGNGIPLFKPSCHETKLKLLSSKNYPSGLIQLHFEVE
jgi:dihydrofolate reductase